jgi:CRISPR/Cas system-associated endonuclease/helicase Cas3
MKTFLKHLYKFQEQTEISQTQMREMILDWYEPMKIYTRKLDGTRMVREMFTVAGPSGNVNYNYEAKGYMILYDQGKLGFRTIVLRNVYKVEKGGRTYLIK